MKPECALGVEAIQRSSGTHTRHDRLAGYQIQRSQLAKYIGRTRRIDTMADPNKRARLHKSG